MIGVDLWNGTPSQVNEFRFVTQVDFPILQNGTNELIPWGLGVENVVVVDPDGITRGVISVADRGKIIELIDLINDPAPVSDLSPKSLYFGLKSEVGKTSVITVKVENTGLRDLVVSEIRSTTNDVMLDRTSFTVAPGATETFKATLVPSSEGDLSGTVTVVTNERTWELAIPELLIEGGLPPVIALPTASVDYGTVEVGRQHTGTIEIRNDGQGPLNVTDLQSDLSGVTFSSSSFTVAAGQSETVTVTYQPTTEGVFDGLVTVLSSDPVNASLTVSLVGTAQVVPADMRTDFDGSGTVDFIDFLGFAGAFGTTDVTYDVDADGTVGFTDFLIFVENFGRSV